MSILQLILGIPGWIKNTWSLWDKFKQNRPQKVEAGLTIYYQKAAPYEVTEPAGATGHAFRYQRLKIKNITNTTLDNCIVKLEEMRRSDGVIFNTAFLPVGLITQHQRLQGRTGGLFKLRAGEEKYVEIAYLDEANPNSEIGLQYETNQYPNSVPRNNYILRIKVYGSNQPLEAFFRLYVDEDGYLRLNKYES